MKDLSEKCKKIEDFLNQAEQKELALDMHQIAYWIEEVSSLMLDTVDNMTYYLSNNE